VAALVLNLVIVPPVAFGLSQLGPAGRAVELGVLMILLTRCIDYVICSRGWRAEATEAVAAAPLLMLAPTQASAFAIA
jgi:arsenite transporter